MSDDKTARRSRMCRTTQECFERGWADGEHDKPLTPEERSRLVALWAPHLRARKHRAS